MKIPLAEHFHSIQGEGHWVGTPMHFIRLPGCSVGKKVLDRGPFLPGGKSAWLCHAFDGQPFYCDTDFNKYEEVELDSLLSETWEDHICITGGEPLLHKEVIEAVLNSWVTGPRLLHIETSGTIEFEFPKDQVWVTVSPKIGYIPKLLEVGNEVKFLVTADTKDDFPIEDYLHPTHVFLSPVNSASGELDPSSLKRCSELLRAHPSWRLSVQLHKYLGVR